MATSFRGGIRALLWKKTENPYRKVYGGMILGRSPFIKDVLQKLKGQYLQKEEISHRRVLHEAYGMEEIIERVANNFKVLKEAIMNKEAPEAKKAAIYLIKKHTAVTNRQIGEHFGGLSYSGVAKITERFSAALKRDKRLSKRIADIEKGM